MLPSGSVHHAQIDHLRDHRIGQRLVIEQATALGFPTKQYNFEADAINRAFSYSATLQLSTHLACCCNCVFFLAFGQGIFISTLFYRVSSLHRCRFAIQKHANSACYLQFWRRVHDMLIICMFVIVCCDACGEQTVSLL